MKTIRHERASDCAAREALLDLCFGFGRRAKTSERLREGRLPALALVATEPGRLIGTVRLWHVAASAGRVALLLGPLAVDPAHRGRGVGAALMERAIAEARRGGHAEIILVGDAEYYARFGFSAARTGGLTLPGPFAQHRLLSLALAAQLEPPTGLLRAAGATAGRVCAVTAGRGIARTSRAPALLHAA